MTAPRSSSRVRPIDIVFLLRGLLLQHLNFWIGPRLAREERGERFDVFLLEEIPRRLGGTEVESIEPVGHGGNPVVRRVFVKSARGAESFAARCFARRLAKEKSREHATIAALLRDAGVQVPEPAFTDARYLTLGRHGFEAVVEKWVVGKYVDPADFLSGDRDALLDNLAEMLARHHAPAATEAGRPWRRRRSKLPFLDDFFTRRETRALDAAEKSPIFEASEEDLSRLREHLDCHRVGIHPGPPYSLVHGDLSRRNLIATGSDPARLVLIDFGTVHYGLWPWDFVGLLNGCFGGNEEIVWDLLDRYLARRSEARREDFDRAWPYLRAFYHLEKCGAALRKHGRRSSGEQETGTGEASGFYRDRAREQWARAVFLANS